VDSIIDAGNWTTALESENVEDIIELTAKDGSKQHYDTNLRNRLTSLSGKNRDGQTTTILLNYNDKTDTSGTGNASVNLTIKPDGNATRTYTKPTQTKGAVSEMNLKVKINPPEKILNIQAGALGLQGIEIKWSALSNSIIGMGGVRTTSYGTAQAAMTATDEAIDMISKVRSGFGAQQNRLEHAYAIDRIIQENTDTAESRIRDTDMARETVIYSKYRLLEQVGQTLLAQANQNKMGILNLLQ
jgi:flagellin-like hook-associated protein FlgL